MEEYKLVLKMAFKDMEKQKLKEILDNDEIAYRFSSELERKRHRLIKAQQCGYFNRGNTV